MRHVAVNTGLVALAIGIAGVASAQPAPPAPPAAPAQAAPPAPPAFAYAHPFMLAHGGSFLGVGVRDIDSERARALKLREERGVEITMVEEGSPAAKAGLKNEDVVLGFNGQNVDGAEQFMRLVRETPAGREVKLVVSRNGAAQTIPVTIASRKGRMFRDGENWQFNMPPVDIPAIHIPEIRIPDIPRPFFSMRNSALGIEAEQLNPELAQYFGVKSGVLVRSVIKGSSAEKAGIRAGDVITKVNGRSVSAPGEISGELHSAAANKQVSLAVTREHRELAVPVSIEERPSGTEPVRTRAVRSRVRL